MDRKLMYVRDRDKGCRGGGRKSGVGYEILMKYPKTSIWMNDITCFEK
jgi:hypothetical protein